MKQRCKLLSPSTLKPVFSSYLSPLSPSLGFESKAIKHLTSLLWIELVIPGYQESTQRANILPDSLWQYRYPSLKEALTISIHKFPCHTDPDTHMHLLCISAREGSNHDNQHPRVCVLWAHDCAACRCSSGADARKSIREMGLQPSPAISYWPSWACIRIHINALVLIHPTVNKLMV